MFNYFLEKKKEIIACLDGFIKSNTPAFSLTGRFGSDTLQQLNEFSSRGKMIRGGLVLLGHELFNGRFDEEAVSVASALELYQSALLIHDDIMDRDTTRRGKPTLSHKFAQDFKMEGIKDFLHLGESLAICAGDIAFFCAFSILSESSLDPNKLQMILQTISKEMGYVGSAQMLDVYFGMHNAGKITITQEDIINLYKYKTGRYTIALPLTVGAHIADAPPKDISLLHGIGEKLGIIFQIKDDELGLYGDQIETGKPVGSDIREGKKTIFYQALFDSASHEEIKILSEIFGNQNITEKEISNVRELLQKYKVADSISILVNSYEREIKEQIDKIEIPNRKMEEVLQNLVTYSIKRKI